MRGAVSSLFFFFNDTATTEIYTLSLHDALPICGVNHLLVASLNWMNQKGGRAAVATSASYITNIYNPAPITLAGPYGAIKQERDDVLSSLALADTLSWGGDAVQLTVGARLQRVNQKMAGYNEQAVSPALGLVVKPWRSEERRVGKE